MSSSQTKGKKRALAEHADDNSAESHLRSPSHSERRAKKPKRAETRTCPVCEDTIPVRLLASHEVFELQRVEEICCARFEDEDLVPWEQIEEEALNTAGPSRRGAALKARRSFNPSQSRVSSFPGSGSGSGKLDLLAKVSKTLKLVQRHRRERQVQLKELSKADLEDDERGVERRTCPVCQAVVGGEVDVVEAHVDACLAHAVTTATGPNGADLEADGLEEYEVGGESRIRITRTVDFRGAGFDVRNPQHDDVEDEIDIDGDDAVVFGDTQFTEKDIIFRDSMNSTEDEEVRVDSDVDEDNIPRCGRVGTSLRDLVAQGKVVLKSDVEGKVATSAIVSADSAALGGLMCRICLDAYIEPTVSTGCWHTCCKDCWLRCLGSTKLCPICKRITAAGDLRRIYL